MAKSAAGPRATIRELEPGLRLEDQVFLVSDKDLRTTSNGGQYIHAILADHTGQLVARMWDANQSLFDDIPRGGLMRFNGNVESYRGKLQFIIKGMRPVDQQSFDPREFLPRTERDTDELWARLKEIMRSVKDPHLLALIGKFVNDDEFAKGFQIAPAAMAMHHAYLGGLLEHTVNVLELALVTIPRYPHVSLDLVLTGIFLHDCGKMRELTYDTAIGYSNEGQLVGHIVMCVTWIQDRVRDIEAETGQPFPADLLNVLKHVILAHHGQYEFGSPKLPAVPEAMAVHYLDNLDAKLEMFRHHVDVDTDDTTEWTGFIPALQTKIFKTDVMNPGD